MDLLAELGLLKFDFLGLTTLTIIKNTLRLIETSSGRKIDLKKIPIDDRAAYQLIAKGQTLGIFQLESAGMIRFMKALKATTIEDIIAGISLYRPGPMESIPTYIKNKNKPQQIRYLTPELKPILEVTYGCLVYQEQVMQIVRQLAGYSYGRSDLVRRAMSKKKMSVMQEERKHFVYGLDDEDGNVLIKGCLRNGIAAPVAEKIFDDMVDFAKYAFNKSHAAGYAIIAYQTAYLKAHYPLAFMAACMTANMHSHKKIARYMKAVKDMNIVVLPPDVNYSEGYFSVENGAIRFALFAVKHVGKGIVKSIIKARRQKPFLDVEDFLKRIDPRELNKKAIESLIKAGALDGFGLNRSVLLADYEQLIDSIQRQRRHNADGQISLFDGLQSEQRPIFNFTQRAALSVAERLNYEREAIGVYVTGHPLDQYKQVIKRISSFSISDLSDDDGHVDPSFDGQRHQLVGMVLRLSLKNTRKGATMAFVALQDYSGEIEVVVFSRILQRYRQLLKEDQIIVVSGTLNVKSEEEIALIAEQIKPLSRTQTANEQQADYDVSHRDKLIYLRVKTLSQHHQQLLDKLSRQFSGNQIIKIFQAASGKVLVYKRRIALTETVIAEFKKLFGDENVRIID